LFVHRPEKRTRADTEVGEPLHRSGCVECYVVIEHDAEHPVDIVGEFGACHRKLNAVDVCEQLHVPGERMTLSRNELVEPLELSESHRCLQICHSEGPAKLLVNESPRWSEAEIP